LGHPGVGVGWGKKAATVILQHAVNIFANAVRESAKRGNVVAQVLTGEKGRSCHWPRLEKEFKQAHSTCAACAGTARLNVHHMQPFHLRPELELVESNLITLCMGEFECHLRIGHGDDFRAYNARVADDATLVLTNPQLRPSVEIAAKAARLYVDDNPDKTPTP
jgi:hypothetical protein